MNEFDTYGDGPLTRLTPELIQGYKNGALPAELKEKVEDFLQRNPFEAEAMDGFNQLTTDQMQQDLADLDQRLQTRTQKAKPGNLWWRVAAVALLLAVSGIVWYINWPQVETKETLALEQTNEEIEPRDIADHSLGSDQSFQSADPQQETLVAAEDEQELDGSRTRADLSANKESTTNDVSPTPPVADADLASGQQQTLANQESDFAEEVLEDEEYSADFLEPVASQAAYSNEGLTLNDSLDIPYEYQVVVGKVINSQTGGPIAGANVLIKGTELATISDKNGFFHFEAPLNAETLVGNSIGFKNSEASIQDLAQIDLIMDVPESNLQANDASRDRNTRRFLRPKSKKLEAEENDAESKSAVSNSSVSGSAQAPANISDYLIQNTVYPARAQALNIEGVVIVGFTVLPNGSLTDFVIIKKLGFGCDEAAVEALRKGPPWKPAQSNGVTVPSQAQMEVYFPPQQ